MASYVDAITQYNPYVNQIPTEAYTKVGMLKQQLYETGVQKVQDSIDYIAGLDIANEGGRQYLKSRIGELTKKLNKYSQVDFSNPNNVSQLTSLAKPLYQDENIVNDVINTGVYRKWYKDANESYKAGKMELGQFTRESLDANQWLNSGVAGDVYTGRSTPNTSTRKDLTDRIIKAKKDGMDQNEYVLDYAYDPLRPYYIKSTNKHYSEAEFNNFVVNNIISDKDREMLMNEHWYENMGRDTQSLKDEDLFLYRSKIRENEEKINELKNTPAMWAEDKKTETEDTIARLVQYNKDLSSGKMAALEALDINNPNSRDVFHRDIAENRYINSLGILLNETVKQEYQKNEQWFTDVDAAQKAAKAASGKSTGEKKNADEIAQELTFYSPVNPDAPKTQVSLGTIRSHYEMWNNSINKGLNNVISKMSDAGIDMSEYIGGYEQVQDPSRAGASTKIPVFRNEKAKKDFYNLVNTFNFAYTIEAGDGKLDNQSLRQWVKQNVLDFNDDDPNAKFHASDKALEASFNKMRGNTALLPRLEKLFNDKSFVRAMGEMDEAIYLKNQKANDYREALIKSNAFTKDEIDKIRSYSNDELLSGKQTTKLLTDEQKENLRRINREAGVKNWQDISMYESGELEGISNEHLKKADEFVKKTYSYVQENINTSMENFKKDELNYNAFKSAAASYLSQSRLQATEGDVSVDGAAFQNLSGFSDIELNTGSLQNTVDIDNPNPTVNIKFKAVDNSQKEPKLKEYTATVSLNSFFASMPNFGATSFGRYFAPLKYAAQDASERIHAAINPFEGSLGSYSSRNDTEAVNARTNSRTGRTEYVYDDTRQAELTSRDMQTPRGTTGPQYNWITLPVEKNGRQTAVTYQVAPLETGRENTSNGYYLKLRVPTSKGSKIIVFKDTSGQSHRFNSPSEAHYFFRDLILNNSQFSMEDIDPKTGIVNYFTTNPNTIRGIFNTQLSYNGYSKLDETRLKDAFGKEMITYQARQMQATF